MQDSYPFPVYPTSFTSYISAQALEQMATPAQFGVSILEACGNIFASVKEGSDGDRRVPIYVVDTLVGYITYYRANGQVRVIVEDQANEIDNNLLTNAAKQTARR